MDKEGLPRYSPVDEFAAQRHRRRHRRRAVKLLVLAFLGYVVFHHWTRRNTDHGEHTLLSVERLHEDYTTCSRLRSVPTDPSGPRERNARYIDGQKPVLIRNATLWTGEPAAGTTPEDAHDGKGYEWLANMDVLVEFGLIKYVSRSTSIAAADLPNGCEIYDAGGRPLTAGLVDMHSHTGVDSLPNLRGTSDTNELSSDITPYVRSIDGFNPLDPQIQVIKSGGISTSLILPGSGNSIGGEAYVLKLAVGKPDGRSELSAESMLADPDRTWRYMKMACGENPKRVYGRVGRDFGPFSRLGEAWYFRHAFEQAQDLIRQQDDWCTSAEVVGAQNMRSYLPQPLEWESLAAVLRGQVMINTHCYTVPDLEAFVRHTNEFKFSVRAFHHAHQTYLVPEILKRAYGNHTPAAALFADNMYYKAEAYVGSEQAGRILYDNGITPVYVSDNPVLNAQHVLFEAAKAYRNGLPYHAALAGVTSKPAELLGLGHRVGKVVEGMDADLVVWDSDPLSVGAAPSQVWVDGVPQFEDPVELKKPVKGHLGPDEMLLDVKDEETTMRNVIFSGVSKVMLLGAESTNIEAAGKDIRVVVREGTITCVGTCQTEVSAARSDNVRTISLKDGHIVPPFTAFGSSLGMAEITAEEDTNDGDNDENSFSGALDGLALDTKNLKAAYRHGVTRAISAPTLKGGGFKGVSVGFKTGAKGSWEKDAVFDEEIAAHYSLTLNVKDGKTPSMSSAVNELREKLLKALKSNATGQSLEDQSLQKVVNGSMPLVLSVHSADIIASILRLKSTVEVAMQKPLRLIILGAAESHLLAPELAAANVPVVLAPLQAYGESWDQRRSLTGAPLTNGTAVDVLYAAGVQVAIGTSEDWQTRDLGLMAGIAHINSGCCNDPDCKCTISEKEALNMVGSNIYAMLGLSKEHSDEFVVYEGNPLEINSRVRAIADGRGEVSVWV